MPLVGSTSPCDEVGHDCPTVRSDSSWPEHHFCCLPMTRLVKAMGHFQLLFRVFQQLICRWSARKRCLLPTSAADLCCHEHPLDPQLPSLRLAPFRPSRPASCPRPRLHAHDNIRPSTTMPDSRCRHLRPWVATQLTLRPPAAATFTVPRRVPGFPSFGPCRLCAPTTDPMRRPQTPPVTSLVPPGCPAGPKRARIRFPRTSSRVRVPQIQGAFRRQVPPSISHCLRSRFCPSGRHWHPGLATKVQLPTRVHAQACALDPSP